MPTAKSETRRRYRDPAGYQRARERARALASYEGRTQFEEPPYDEVKVVVLTNPAGEKVRVTEDQVETYQAIFAEQAAAAKPAKPAEATGANGGKS